MLSATFSRCLEVGPPASVRNRPATHADSTRNFADALPAPIRHVPELVVLMLTQRAGALGFLSVAALSGGAHIVRQDDGRI